MEKKMDKKLNKINKRKIAVSALVLFLALGAGIYGANRASAQNNPPFNSLIDKLVAKFSLNKNEVTQLFEEDRAARQAEMEKERQAKTEDRLAEAVKNGEITEAQKNLILNKMAELEKQRETDRATHQNLSDSERKAQRENHRAELEKWASDNKIDVKYLMFGGRGKGGGYHEGDGLGLGQGNGNGNRQGQGTSQN